MTSPSVERYQTSMNLSLLNGAKQQQTKQTGTINSTPQTKPAPIKYHDPI
jgi:hypothetical protein